MINKNIILRNLTSNGQTKYAFVKWLVMSKIFFCISLVLLNATYIHAEKRGLEFNSLSTTWDEGLPLGNAVIGALIWNHDGVVRLSLDRTDLWDLRANDSIAKLDYDFDWVVKHIKNGNYRAVQAKLDDSYDRFPYPTKIPGAALELPGLPACELIEYCLIDYDKAEANIKYNDGTLLTSFVHATEPVGWIRITGKRTDKITPRLKSPEYASTDATGMNSPLVNSHAGQSLRSLGYEQGTVEEHPGFISYRQPGHDDFEYDVNIRYTHTGDTLTIIWGIGSTLGNCKSQQAVAAAMERGYEKDFLSHLEYWRAFNDMSSISVPDSMLQRQYDSEMYKLGSLSRKHSYPISLQGVWTADNGQLPPWKGDYHHDLNTQLSYWPVYIGNHLDEGEGYLNTLWNQRDVYKRYTKSYFGKDGMNVPGVCTLLGEPMGGWIQYSMGQTVGAWLAHHFYMHWKYSGDDTFLEKRAYPFTKDVAIFLEQQMTENTDGLLTLEFSSSPEYNDNSREAWFDSITNYELALARWLFKSSAELADSIGLKKDAKHWSDIYTRLPKLSIGNDNTLNIAPGVPLATSHRHMSHLMAIYPLSLLDPLSADSTIINASLAHLDKLGPDYWTGYSYAWYAAMQAIALNGNKAIDALKIFSECFCLPNTFHVNGDQSNTGKSKFTYRPFTLEGNMAFAAALQLSLMQSHTGVIRLFPAIPDSWKDVSFDKLRAYGGFLVSATLKNGVLDEVSVYHKTGGIMTIELPDGVKTIKIVPDKWITLVTEGASDAHKFTLKNKP